MAILTPTQVAALALDAGWTPADATTATAIALAESKPAGNTESVGDEHLTNDKWGPSIGLWQVRSLRSDSGTGRSRDATRLTDPAFNASAAYTISGRGRNWSPWSMYTNGDYRQYLGVARDGVANASGDPSILDNLRAMPFGLGYGAGLGQGGAQAAAGAATAAARGVLGAYGLGWLTTPAGRRTAAQVAAGAVLVLAAGLLYSGGDATRMIKDLADVDLGGSS